MKDKYEEEKVNREDRVTGGGKKKKERKEKKKRESAPCEPEHSFDVPAFIRGEQRLGSTFSGAKFAFPCP